MKKFYLFTKTLLVAVVLLVGASNAWGDTTIGANNKGWTDAGSCTSSIALAANKTLTLNFTVTSSAGGNHQGHVIILAKGNASTWGANQFLFLRSDYAYRIGEFDWNLGALSNVNSDPAVATKDFFEGASVQTVIERMGPVVTITTSVTKDATTHTNTHKQIIDTSDNIYVFLAADGSVLTLPDSYSSIADTDTSSHPTTITLGKSDNTGDFYGTYVNTLGQNESMNMQFTNYSGTTDTYKTWGIELVYPNSGSKYLDIVAGNTNVWGDLTTDAKTAQLTTSSNWPADILTAMNEADVTLTVTRQGRFVYITAVHTPTSGNPFTLTYTLEPKDAFSDFATTNLGVRIMTDHSHVDYNYSVGKVNAEVSKYGWSTFSSQYKLDFSGVAGLEAYAVTGHDGNVITKSDALGVVAANTGVLLKGTEGSTSTFYNIPVSTGAAYDGTNKLVAGTGASVSKEDNMTKYVLGVSAGNEAEFQKIDGTAATVAKGKAYLVFDGESLARSMSLTEDLLTGISEAAAATEAVVKEGKFFENGKLIIFKKGMKFNANGQVIK